MSSEPENTIPIKPDSNEVKKPKTAILPIRQHRINRTLPTQPGTKSLKNQRELLLVVRGMVERMSIPYQGSIVLGRVDLRVKVRPDVDLTPYGALERGVSREHVRLHIDKDHLFVTDLNSTNGTFLGGKRLEPNIATQIRKGDELLIGRLPVQILFR